MSSSERVGWGVLVEAKFCGKLHGFRSGERADEVILLLDVAGSGADGGDVSGHVVDVCRAVELCLWGHRAVGEAVEQHRLA